MRKIKVFCSTFLITLFLVGTVSVFASDVSTSEYVINGQTVVLSEKDGYDYKLLYHASEDDTSEYSHYFYIISGTPIRVMNTNRGFRHEENSIVQSFDVYVDHVKYYNPSSGAGNTFAGGYDVLYSSHDIENYDGNVVVQKKTFPKSLPVNQVQKLPPTILMALKPIVIIAVSCLGLLISCLVLLPRLRNYLHL